MKYKCQNCGQIYSQYTEYCDCGNNVFDEIIENTDYIHELYHNKEDNEFSQNEDDSENKNVDIASVMAICSLVTAIIIFSALMFKACSIPDKNIVKTDKIKSEIEMPAIDTFWDNTAPKSPENTKAGKNDAVLQVPNKSVQTNKNSQISPNSIINSNVQSVNKSNVQRSNQNKVIQYQNDKEKQKLAEEKRKLEVEKQKIAAEKIKLAEEKILEEKKKLAAEKQRIEEQKKIEEQKRLAEQKRLEELQKQQKAKELSDYKNAIRNTLFANFPILTVSGYGSSQVAFTISSDGKLLNRRFVQQSNNKSLDDAMYHMLMKTPIVKNPPNSYNGEEIILKMDFNNGSYSFSYVK